MAFNRLPMYNTVQWTSQVVKLLFNWQWQWQKQSFVAL